MPTEQRTEDLTRQTSAAVARYAATLHAAAGAEHHVVSGLGAWLVLALAGQAGTVADARGAPADDTAADGHAVAEALGLPLAEAGRIAVDLLGELHPAVAAAVGLWWREDVVTDRLTAYVDRLPAGATREPLAGQAQLDDWAREHSLGLIDHFPGEVTPDVLLVLASALATKVRWQRPFSVVPATELAVPGSRGGFADAVTRALRSVPGHDVRLVRTEAAGLVGAHVAASGDGLAVVSVLGSPEVDRAAVLAAAHEVALGLDGTRIGTPMSLFDVPAGLSDLGEIVEDIVRVGVGVDRVELGRAVLPTWQASTELDLLTGPPAHGFRGAGRLLAGLLPPRPPALDARQVAVASYTREGFEAAAISMVGVAVSARVLPNEVARRTLTVRFDRPYAAVAVAVEPPKGPAIAGSGAETGTTARAWFGLPVFSAWVAEPAETTPVEPDS